MRWVYLLRHAQKDNDARCSDKEVPLHPNGKKQALQVGRYMEEQQLRPDIILSSDAKRTRQTIEAVLDGCRSRQGVQYLSQLYYNTAGGMLTMLQGTKGRYQSVMVVGHNPGIHQFALMLAGSAKDEALVHKIKLEFPPAAFVGISFNITDWRQLGPGRGCLEWCVYPSDM